MVAGWTLGIGGWAGCAHGAHRESCLVGVGSIGLERVVLRGDRIVLDGLVVVWEGGAGGHHGRRERDGRTERDVRLRRVIFFS